MLMFSRTETRRVAYSVTIALGVASLLFALAAVRASADSGGVGPNGPSSGGGSGGDVVGVPSAYSKFSGIVSGKTDISLRVVGAWTLAEGGPNDNPLNIGPGEQYGTVKGAASATAKLLRNSMYEPILESTDEPDMEQIQAIAESPWCTNCGKRYERLLRSTYRQVKVEGS